MSNDIPQDLVYTKDHEWAKVSGSEITVGITAFAVEQLGDITLVTIDAKPGDALTAGKAFGTIESVKTLSDLAAVHQRSPLEAVTIDRSLGHVLKTTDAGDSWVRMPYNMIDMPRALVMFDDERGIIGADLSRFYRTTDNWNSYTTVSLFGFGNAAARALEIPVVGGILAVRGQIDGDIPRRFD